MYVRNREEESMGNVGTKQMQRGFVLQKTACPHFSSPATLFSLLLWSFIASLSLEPSHMYLKL